MSTGRCRKDFDKLALIDLVCTDDACGHVTENHYRTAAQWQDELPACVQCGQSTERIFLPPRVSWSIDPIVVFQAPDGSYRFPGDANGLSAANYAKQGLTRVELRSAADVRRFERDWSARERSAGELRTESAHRQREARESTSRGELFRQMRSMSAMGRDVARAAMATGNARPQPRAHDPGCHVEAFSYDRSNREAARDSRGQRRRD
jgi:hypothetical protein